MPCFDNVAVFRPIKGRQRGFGLLEVMLLIAVFGGLASAGYLELRKRATVQAARQEQAVLSQADAAVLTFATVHHRLPCPDTDRDGLENCAGDSQKGQKGWLPSISLQLAGADPGVEVGQLRYLVQRGAVDYDLALLADDWRPLEYDKPTFENMRETTAHGGDYPANTLTLTDLCQRLEKASKVTLTPDMAQVTATPARAVAYALAHPGLSDAAGNNSPFDGVNGAAGNAMEDPARFAVLSTYDDLVFERSFASLQQVFGCAPLAQSINTVALGLDVVEQVEDMREGNKEAAIRAVAFAALGAAMTGVELTAAAIEAASDGGNAAAEFAACVASLGIAVNFCSAAPMHVSSAVLAGVTAGFNGVSLGLNIAAAVMAGNALALVDKDSAPSSQSCPKIDFSQALASTQQELNSARADLIALEASLPQKQSDLTAANAAKTAAINALYTAARSESPTLETEVDKLIQAANGWFDKKGGHDTAVGQTKHFLAMHTSLDDQVKKYDDMLANRVVWVAQLSGEIAALDAQIAVLPEGPAKQELNNKRLSKAADLNLLNDETALQAERDKAVVDRTKAAGDLVAAQAAEATALSQITPFINGYQAAYNTLKASSASTASALSSLMGEPPADLGATQPHAKSKFTQPKVIEREIAALTGQIESGQKRVAAAQTRYNELLAQSNTLQDCPITGSVVTPFAPAAAAALLVDTDTKGGTR